MLGMSSLVNVFNQQLIARARRYSVSFIVEISGPTVGSFLCRVSNISSSGMLIEEAGGLKVGDAFYAQFPGMPARLCVIARLRKGGGAGAKFKGPIPTAAECSVAIPFHRST